MSAPRLVFDPPSRNPLTLPFVTQNRKGDPFDYWSVTATGDFDQDCRLGSLFGHQAVAFMLGERSTLHNTLAAIVRSLREKERIPGLEIGFFNEAEKSFVRLIREGGQL